MSQLRKSPAGAESKLRKSQNGIGEWTVTILLLLFCTTTLCQAFVIPTGSMEDTLLVGDHVLVDKLAYAPAGPISRLLLPYEGPRHGDMETVPDLFPDSEMPTRLANRYMQDNGRN